MTMCRDKCLIVFFKILVRLRQYKSNITSVIVTGSQKITLFYWIASGAKISATKQYITLTVQLYGILNRWGFQEFRLFENNGSILWIYTFSIERFQSRFQEVKSYMLTSYRYFVDEPSVLLVTHILVGREI